MVNIKDSVTWRLHKVYRGLRQPFRKLPEVELDEIIAVDVAIEPPILADICLPPHYGTNNHDDLTPLLKIVRSLQPSIVVELGTAHGNSAANICNQSPQTKVYTVNAPVEEQSGVITTYDLTREEIGRVYREHGFANRVTQIFANTLHLDLAQYFSQPAIDLAIIDACHDTDYVINDFQKLLPFVRPGGLVLFHDTYPSLTPSHLDGSYDACLKLRASGYDIRHLRKTWWALWINNVEAQKNSASAPR